MGRHKRYKVTHSEHAKRRMKIYWDKEREKRSGTVAPQPTTSAGPEQHMEEVNQLTPATHYAWQFNIGHTNPQRIKSVASIITNKNPYNKKGYF